MNIALNEDCMAVMARYPDKYFDLAVVDPPYGGVGGLDGGKRFGGWFDRYKQNIPDGREMGGKVRKKNCELGLCPRRGLFRRTFPCFQKSNHLGR